MFHGLCPTDHLIDVRGLCPHKPLAGISVCEGAARGDKLCLEIIKTLTK